LFTKEGLARSARTSSFLQQISLKEAQGQVESSFLQQISFIKGILLALGKIMRGLG
jgi:hypothetical protein